MYCYFVFYYLVLVGKLSSKRDGWSVGRSNCSVWYLRVWFDGTVLSQKRRSRFRRYHYHFDLMAGVLFLSRDPGFYPQWIRYRSNIYRTRRVKLFSKIFICFSWNNYSKLRTDSWVSLYPAQIDDFGYDCINCCRIDIPFVLEPSQQ